MKEFFKMFFASLLAMAVAVAGSFLLMIVLVAGLSSLSKQTPVVQKDSVLVFDMSTNIQDRPVGLTGREFFDQVTKQAGPTSLSLRNVTRAIRKAADDGRIKAMLIKGSLSPVGYGSGYAALKEVRQAIKEFEAAGKPVWAYVVYPTARDMYIVSAADKTLMNPEGLMQGSGMLMGAPYFAGFLDRYGIGVQVTRAGEYKAAAESFVRNDMSAPAREANQAYLDTLWNDYVNTITEGSKLDGAGYQKLLDSEGLIDAKKALEVGLVDELAFTDRVLELAQTQVPAEEDGASFRNTTLGDYIDAAVTPQYSSDGHVAVIYAEGSIVDGEGKENQIGGDRLARVIRDARLDSDTKAIVLRVNSPGGSALASEVIQHELRLAKKKMPVVVSMGAVAASGGYWISTYGDRIFAEPNTLTGSIGVIGIFFNFKEIAGTHGINFDMVKTTRFADVMTPYRPKTDEEMAIVQKQVDAVYGSFLSKVSEGRGLPLDKVKEIAQGRIWSGKDALKLGLVDEMGGLDDAIAYAGRKAGLGETPAVQELPEAKNFIDELMKELSHEKVSASSPMMQSATDVYDDIRETASVFNDPRGVYAVAPFALKVK